ncbi:MAG: hypothetical protein R3F34_11795 [Planctomycetota bacterium]
MRLVPIALLALLVACSSEHRNAAGKVVFPSNGIIVDVPAGWNWDKWGDETFEFEVLTWDDGRYLYTATAPKSVSFDKFRPLIEGEILAAYKDQHLAYESVEDLTVAGHQACIVEESLVRDGKLDTRWHLYLDNGAVTTEAVGGFPDGDAAARDAMYDAVLSIVVP